MLKPVDTYPAGGVDSRSNPVNMPPGRYLYVRDFWPQQDGSFRLRDGYSQYVGGLQPNVPIYSIQPVVGTGPNYKPLIVFWQNLTPYTLDPFSMTITSPIVKGAAIQSGARWSYFYTNGHLHAFNGTDAKWYDGVYWRDIGLPTLTAAQIAGITVTQGLAAVTQTQANAAALAFQNGGTWSGLGNVTVKVYLAFFDTTNNLLMTSPFELSGSPLTGTLGIGANQEISITTLPTCPDTNAVGLLAFNINNGPGACFVLQTSGGLPFQINIQNITNASTTVTVQANSHGRTTGDIIFFDTVSTLPTWSSNGPFAITVIDSNHFSFQTPNAAQYTMAASGATVPAFSVLAQVANGATTATIPNPFSAFVYGEGQVYNNGGAQLFPYADELATSGIPASSIGGAQPGYQFYLSIYNLTTGHVGNRQPIGIRIAPTAATTFILSGLPTLTDSEWVLLLGRTSDGAEIPYAIDDVNGNWITTPLNSTASILVTSGTIDGNSELPSRNYPPPGTLDYNYQLTLLPGGALQNPPVIGTFFAAWVESDHCCGAMQGSPTVGRSGSALDDREGVFVGLPEQSWDPADIETFPTAAPITCGQGYQGESWVYTHEDCGVLMELAGETSWQGPWNVGGAGQYAWARAWQNMPFWVTGDKQLATVSSGGYLQMGGLMTTAASGPIIVSDEYEAALLSQIGSQYLSQTEVLYIRKPAERVEVLRIHARDVNGNPLTIIHDFNLRDERSPYGQAYLEAYQGALSTVYAPVQTTISTIQGIPGSQSGFSYNPPLAGAVVASVAGLAVGQPIVVAGVGNGLFDGNFIIYAINPTTSTVFWVIRQGVGDNSSGGTLTYPGGVPTFCVVRDQNWQSQVLAGAPNGNIYELYSGSSDNGTPFTAQALALIYVGPERTAIKYLEWYGDENTEFFTTRDLTVPFDTSQMESLCANEPEEVQGDENAQHWTVSVQASPEKVHAYVVIQLTAHPADGSVGLNSPPHIPLESYGRVWLIEPVAGVSRGKG